MRNYWTYMVIHFDISKDKIESSNVCITNSFTADLPSQK